MLEKKSSIPFQRGANGSPPPPLEDHDLSKSRSGGSWLLLSHGSPLPPATQISPYWAIVDEAPTTGKKRVAIMQTEEKWDDLRIMISPEDPMLDLMTRKQLCNPKSPIKDPGRAAMRRQCP